MKSVLYPIVIVVILLGNAFSVATGSSGLRIGSPHQETQGQQAGRNGSNPALPLSVGRTKYPLIRLTRPQHAPTWSEFTPWWLSKLNALASWVLRTWSHLAGAQQGDEQTKRAQMIAAGTRTQPMLQLVDGSRGSPSFGQQRHHRSLQINYQAAVSDLWEAFEDDITEEQVGLPLALDSTAHAVPAAWLRL